VEIIYKAEQLIESWHKSLPHLPANLRKWIADNGWWIVLVGVVLMSLQAVGVLAVLLIGTVAAGVLGGLAILGPLTAVAGGLLIIVGAIFFTVFLIELVLSAMAISPLKAKQRKGWVLIFTVSLIEVVSAVLTFIFSMEVFSFIWGLAWAAAGLYILFEVRDAFKPLPAHHRK